MYELNIVNIQVIKKNYSVSQNISLICKLNKKTYKVLNFLPKQLGTCH